MARALVTWTLGLMVVMAWAPLVVAKPCISGDFLSWCNMEYQSSCDMVDLIQNLVAMPLGTDQGHSNMMDFQQNFLDTQWLPWDAQSTTWSQSMHGFQQPGGVFHMAGAQHPPTLAQFQQSPSTYVREALDKLAQLLQPTLLDVASKANIAIDGMIFQAMFNWKKANGSIKVDTCMPYNKAKLRKRKIKDNERVKNFNVQDGYLRMWCGLGPTNPNVVGSRPKNVYEYAHRLVCFSFHGAPHPHQHKVVNHLCHNRECCNPRHMEWTTIQANFSHS